MSEDKIWTGDFPTMVLYVSECKVRLQSHQSFFPT